MHRWANKKDMAGDDPPYLSVGTEVSAKYKGAFCEAKIRKVVKTVRCKVQYKNESGSAFINDDQIKGVLMAGASVEVKQPDNKDFTEGTIIKIQDLSQYTVVFDDGDIATLRRTALCLKSGRHFAEGETLDQLPLTHPEHFSTPVVSGIRGSRRRDEMEENSDDESKRERKIEREEDMGKVVCVEVSDKKKSKDNWFPGLIVAPNAQDSVKIDVEDEYLVRSFKDGRYYTVPKRETVEFTREVGAKVDHPTLKMAVEKAISFLDKDDLPPHWDRDVLFGMIDFTSESDGSDTDSTDDEPREEKDHFVAQLYKFMDDRGTPINKGPMISSKDVDLYKLFKIVNKLGGCNRVTNRNQWKSVAIKLGYTTNQTNNVKSSYKKYLHNFEDFYRKLGCTMISHNAGNKLRSRSHRPLIRDRDKSLPEKSAERDENNLYGDESPEVKEPNVIKAKVESQIKDEIDIDDKQKECRKDNVKLKKELSTESAKEDDKVKKNNVKIESVVVKDAQPGVAAPKEKAKIVKEEIKEEKPVGEKKSERKVVKLVPKVDCNDGKKLDKPTIKTKTGKLKGVEKRIKKAENGLPANRNKRSLKERMKAIVKRLKLKSGVGSNSNEQDKKKQKSAEETNKGSPQLYKLKSKEEVLNNGTKTRKLSVANDSKNGNDAGANIEKKSAANISSNGNGDGPGSVGTFTKVKKNEEDSEGIKKKTYTRKKKDDDRHSSSSADNLMNQSIEIVSPHKTICIGDKLKVYYGPTHESKVTYEAKVMNKRYGAVTEYFVHYTGWNTRYDEWIRRSRIAEDLSWTPARDKLKYNQNDTPSTSTSSSQIESPVPSQNPFKTSTERVKRSSISPVGKVRSKSVTKSLKQLKNVKSKSPTKFDSKKKSASKDSDSSEESDSESNGKQELQKTRSRTEKRKLQDEDGSSKDGKDVEKKKPPPLKRTRSGSLKLESKEQPLKKRKVTPTKTKTSRANAIRNSIMKNLVPRKRMAEKGKKLLKKKDACDKEANDFDPEEGKEVKEIEDEVEMKMDKSDEEKETDSSADGSKLDSEELEKLECEETELVVKIKPFPVVGVVVEESDVDKVEEMAEVKESDDSGPPLLKKETLSDDDAGVSTSQFLADSYLAENLEKPKVVKAKTKKEEEKSPKIFNRTNEKQSPKTNSDVKEKTFFTSRIDKLETKKAETPEKDKKEGKIRGLASFSSYLNMDKIDSIRKVNHLEKTPEKGADKPGMQKTPDSSSMKCEDDIYEFKEPEPFEFRPTGRLFDDSPYKRQKVTTSPSDVKEDEVVKLVEDGETKREAESEEKGEEEKTVKTEPNTEKTVVQPQNPDTSKDDSKSETAIKVEPTTVQSDDSKELSKLDSTADSSLFSLQNEDDEEDDDSKLVISESEQMVDSVSLTESIANKILGVKINEISVVFRESDEDDKGSDLEKECKPVGDKLVNKSAALLKSDDLSDKNADESDKSLKNDDLDSDDDSISSAKSSSCSIEKDNAKGESDSILDERDDYSSDESPKEGNAHLLRKEARDVEMDFKKSTPKSDSDDESDDDEMKIDDNFEDAEDNSDSGETFVEASIIDEVEIEVFTAKKDGVEQAETKPLEDKAKLEDEVQKSKDDDDNDGLLLCEETIPKSPESKDVNVDGEVFPSGSGISDKKVEKNKLKKGPRPAAFPSATTVFENTPPTTPEDSTPGDSPSDERSGFASTTFSLNEKNCMNKDSSENDTYSDNSERSMKMKKYRDENGTYNKKNSYEFDSYLKRKIEKDSFFKRDEPGKKRSKQYGPASANESEKDDFSDEANSPKTTSLAQKFTKSSYYLDLDPDLDANQRIEVLEQKLQELRKAYLGLKQELSSIDKRRKKLRRREREGRMMTRNEANSLL